MTHAHTHTHGCTHMVQIIISRQKAEPKVIHRAVISSAEKNQIFDLPFSSVTTLNGVYNHLGNLKGSFSCEIPSVSVANDLEFISLSMTSFSVIYFYVF